MGSCGYDAYDFANRLNLGGQFLLNLGCDEEQIVSLLRVAITALLGWSPYLRGCLQSLELCPGWKKRMKSLTSDFTPACFWSRFSGNFSGSETGGALVAGRAVGATSNGVLDAGWFEQKSATSDITFPWFYYLIQTQFFLLYKSTQKTWQTF